MQTTVNPLLPTPVSPLDLPHTGTPVCAHRLTYKSHTAFAHADPTLTLLLVSEHFRAQATGSGTRQTWVQVSALTSAR